MFWSVPLRNRPQNKEREKEREYEKDEKLTASLLAVTVAVGLLAGCGKQSGTTAPAAESAPAGESVSQAAEEPATADTAEPVEVTIAIWGAEDACPAEKMIPSTK